MSVWQRQWVPALVAIAIAVGWSSMGLAQDKDPMIGTWKLNVAKSTYSPGPGAKEASVTIEASGAGRHVEVTGVAGDGTAMKWGYTANFDNKEYRVTGTNPDADVVMLRRLSPTTIRSISKKDGKQTLRSGVSVSADGKTLTVAQEGVNAKGQTVKNTIVFDRQ